MSNTACRIVSALVIITLTISAATACIRPNNGASADYPEKPIDLIVPFAAGGASDRVARGIRKQLSNQLGVPVNVINKPGADQISGVQSVLRAEADGHTLLLDTDAASTMQALTRNLPYEWDDRTFVGRLGLAPQVYAVASDSPWKSLDDVLRAARRNPGQLSVAWLGGETSSDYTLRQFFDVAKVDISKVKKVPFQGSGDAMQAAAAGDVDFAVGGPSATLSLRDSGDLRVLAVSGDKRVSSLSNVPTTAEIGKKELDFRVWYGVSGPPDLPASVIERLQRALRHVATESDALNQLDTLGLSPAFLGHKAFSAFVHQEATRLRGQQTSS